MGYRGEGVGVRERCYWKWGGDGITDARDRKGGGGEEVLKARHVNPFLRSPISRSHKDPSRSLHL